jgi:hypothetical protein
METITTDASAILEAVVFRLFAKLQQRRRWHQTSPNIQPDNLVLLREDNTTPLQWPTAIIQDVHP